MAHLASVLDIRETLFTTNQLPSEDESKAIKAKLVQLRAERTKLKLRLSNIEAILPELEAIRHPMRCIPDDILGLIFECATPWCLADGIAEDSFPPRPNNPKPGKLGAPWILSHVCRNWRAVCLSLPHLWSTLRVGFPGLLGNTQCAMRIATMCQRSLPLPLRLYITGSFPSTILQVVLDTTHRWRCICMPTSHVSLPDYFFPCLTHLALYFSFSAGKISTNVVAPRLHNLELRDGRINPGLRLPWHQITRYTSVNTSLDFLQHMKNLEEITINEDKGVRAEVHQTQHIILPRMRRLEYDGIHGIGGLNSLLRRFDQSSFTSLRTLVLFNPYYEDSDPPIELSLPSVVELSLCFGSAHYGVRNILRATPNVQSLHIDGGEDPQSLMDEPHYPEWPSVASLHQLKHLSFPLTGANPFFDIAALDGAVAGLKTYELPLETISFYGGDWKGGTSGMKSEGKWLAFVCKGMNRSLDMCMKNGIQIRYHYDTEHRFS
ncbi:hypothetical protein CYLTODRAFT_426980, partial [Cylindrobasidium torrendii FP15055 ss-10]